ncbi:hypothetical protein Golax_014527 [Gossypium laxum]|uniref:Uncharacterized protein n=1 Tax=Gossypium laxum TaxID=34288 RepID=A0A7J8ZVD1_9ROSI|nr:hypothetical protein [Gossypium laxum]
MVGVERMRLYAASLGFFYVQGNESGYGSELGKRGREKKENGKNKKKLNMMSHRFILLIDI